MVENFMCDTNQPNIKFIRHGSQISSNRASDKSVWPIADLINDSISFKNRFVNDFNQ